MYDGAGNHDGEPLLDVGQSGRALHALAERVRSQENQQEMQ